MTTIEERLTAEEHKTDRNDVLKLIAIITMLIDHIGFFFFPEDLIFRQIGKSAFPIFAYHIGVGYTHTRDFNKYSNRLMKFALISQAPYLIFCIITRGSMGYNPLNLNVLFLLYAGLYTIKFYDFLKSKKGLTRYSLLIALILILATPRILSVLLVGVELPFIEGRYNFSLSYGSYGLIMILIFYIYRDKFIDSLIAYFLLSYFHSYVTETIHLTGIYREAEPLLRLKNLAHALFIEPFQIVIAAG